MFFGEIVLKNTGLNTKDYPHCSSIDVTLYDVKDRPSNEKVVNYAKPLFSKNEDSFNKFKQFIEELEKGNVTSMCVKIDENVVVLFYKTQRPVVFLRNPPMDLIDFMG